ncbi:MAG: radical SAM protein [Dehalococcoidales bacterium]|nr:radical SAM protein [Dehalococcoidales bacterium]
MAGGEGHQIKIAILPHRLYNETDIMAWAEVEKARRRLSREEGTIIKDWGGRIPIALVYPNSYYVGMSNLGVHALYSLLNSYSQVVSERAFWEVENRNSRSPALCLESQRPLSDFAVVAFSISYELDYFNVVHILKASGIPLYAADRDERHPLVIAGGPCIIANPLPLSPFFDCLCIGEAEPMVPVMLPVIAEGILGRRSDLLKALASLPGVYVPQYYSGKPVVRQWAKNLDDFPVASAILTPDTELGDLYLIEVERGCNWGCRFCLASKAFSPMRHRSVDNLIAQAELGLKYRKRLGLVGAAVSDYPQIEELLLKLGRMGAELSISSLRMAPLSSVVLRELAKGGARTIALAPEAGSQRLRQVIKKGISEEDILEAMGRVAEQGIKQVKLYFMIGLPSETDEDIEGIIKLTLNCKRIIDRQQTGCRLVLTISPFVPKAGTPFQWLPMTPPSILNRRLSLLKSNLMPKGIKIKGESAAWSQVQGVLSRGDIKLAEVLANIEEVSLSGWRQAVEKCHLDIDFYVHQRWDTDQKLPWGMIDLGTESEKLKLELERALAQH